MNCQTAIELLPWLLNGSLQSTERQALEAHLAECADCRRELQETRAAGAVFAVHLPTEVLLDRALGRSSGILPAALVDRHLEDCPECAEELALLQAGHAAVEPPALPASRSGGGQVVEGPWVRRGWRAAALAASLVGMVALSGWIWTAVSSSQLAHQEQLASRRIGELEQRLESLRSEDGDAAGRIAELEAEIARLSAAVEERGEPVQVAQAEPSLQLGGPLDFDRPILELMPQTAVRGEGEDGEPAVLTASGGQAQLSLFLPLEASRYDRLQAELRTAGGDLLASADGRCGDPSFCSVVLGEASLPVGELIVELFGLADGERQKLATYPLRVE